MNQIWTAIVKDSTSSIDTHFEEIMGDLLKSMVDGREWRSREASCAAMADLVQGRRLEKVSKTVLPCAISSLKCSSELRANSSKVRGIP